jgi:DNA segregation ATPase FtsK/SpoIIIE-like protein
LKTLFDHWVKHNDSHIASYKDWAKKARDNKMPETATLLDDVAALTESVSKKIEEALKSIAGKTSSDHE